MKSLATFVVAVVAVVSLIANGLLYSRYSTSRPIVTFGGEKVTKKEYQDALEYQSGQAVLTKLVFSKLVHQAAAREGVLPTGPDVEARMNDLKRRTPQVLAPYSEDPTKMDQFRQDLETAISLENLRIKNVSVSPAEVQAYYAAHRKEFVLPPQVKATTVVTENSVDAETAATLLRQKTPPDVIARQPRLHVAGVNGFNPGLQSLPAPLLQKISQTVFTMHPGEVRTIPVGNDFFTFQAINRVANVAQPLSQVRDQATREAKLLKAPSADEEIAALYQAAKPQFEVDRYQSYFDAVQNADLTKKPTGRK